MSTKIPGMVHPGHILPYSLIGKILEFFRRSVTTRHPSSQHFSKLVKKTYSFPTKIAFFPTLNDDSTAHCPARKKVPFLIVFCCCCCCCFCLFDFLFTHRYTTDPKAPPPPGIGHLNNFSVSPVQFRSLISPKLELLERNEALPVRYLFPCSP